jgi:putative FmdB family regulatory protein
MPVYEYQCVECGERFELFLRSATQKATLTCPKCGSPEVKKALSLFGVGGVGGSDKTSTASCGPTAST